MNYDNLKKIIIIDLIVDILEHYCFEHRRQLPTGYVVDSLRSAGVPTEVLLDVYTVSMENKVKKKKKTLFTHNMTCYVKGKGDGGFSRNNILNSWEIYDFII